MKLIVMYPSPRVIDPPVIRFREPRPELKHSTQIFSLCWPHTVWRGCLANGAQKQHPRRDTHTTGDRTRAGIPLDSRVNLQAQPWD